MKFWELIVISFFIFIVGWLLAFLLFGMFWIIPVSMNAEAKCLAKGYPKTSVDWKGNGYCMNLEGTVTVKLEKLQ